MIALSSVLVFAFCLSWAVTYFFIKYARRINLVDVPNSRSSHTIPTPRGGGVAIVVSFALALLIFSFINVLEWKYTFVLVFVGVSVALIGFIDDHGHVPAVWRLLVHFAASIFVINFISMGTEKFIPKYATDYIWIINCISVIFFVWFINLFNFMDGIDCLAGGEAITVSVCMSVIYFYTGNNELVLPPLALAAAVGGLIYWNIPPAQVFMGDTGSGFLGAILGIIAIYSISVDPVFLWSWLIMLAVFITDATFTLIHRIICRLKIFEAHRTHAYQHAAFMLRSHSKVVLIVLIINFVWLFPISFAVSTKILGVVTGLALAFIPLIIIVWILRAVKDGNEL